jgi:aldehyde dehydrogenase (NAD+)
VVGQATNGTVADMARAVGAARRAFDTTEWARDVEFRYHCLTQLHGAFERNAERLRRIVVTEVGCPISMSGSQIDEPIKEVKHRAEHGRAVEYLEDIGVHDTQLGPARRKIHYDPVASSVRSRRGTCRSISTSPRRHRR